MAAKRQPLSVMIGLASKKMRGGDDKPDDGGDEPDDDFEANDDEEIACQDVLDAVKKGSAKDLGRALHKWMQIAGYDKAEE